MSGIIRSVEPGSVGAIAGLQAGDTLVAINDHALRDVIDVQFYSADAELALDVQRAGQLLTIMVHRDFGQAFGVEFEHPTFDIDIRRCNNLCPFCFVLQNAPRMRRTLYIKDDDYRYSFLFGHFITLTNLSDEDWARLAEQRLSPLYVSVHATDTEIRRRCLRNPSAPDILAQLRWLADHGIETHTQLVITPGLNDGPHLEQSIRDLTQLYPHVRSVSVVPVGLTQHHKYGHRPPSKREVVDMLDQVHAWQQDFRTRFGTGFVYATDEWYLVAGRRVPRKSAYDGLALQENGLGMVRDFLDEWQRLRRSGELRHALQATITGSDRNTPPPHAPHHSASLATATLFAPTLRQIAQDFAGLTGFSVSVHAIRNERLGESITVAGLLMGGDVVRQLANLDQPLGDVVVLPRIMFDHPDGISLDDLTPMDVARALHRPVALADWMGDVLDALIGKNRLVFDPGTVGLDVPVAHEGGWAVEKYL